LPPHALPSVLHVVFSATQLPPVHVPLQQSPLALHDFPSLVHDGG
jgi:hypothetical protein